MVKISKAPRAQAHWFKSTVVATYALKLAKLHQGHIFEHHAQQSLQHVHVASRCSFWAINSIDGDNALECGIS